MAVISTVTLEFTILVCPCLLGGKRLHHVPMLRDKAVFNTEKIVISGRNTAEGAFAAGESIVAVGKNHMRLVIDHRDALFRHSRKRSTESGKTVSDGDIVLDVFVAVVVGSQLFRMLSAKHVAYESRSDAAGLFLIDVFLFKRTVDLGVTGRIGGGNILKIVPMLIDFAVGVEMEHVKRNLFARAGEIVNGLQEDLIAVLKRADVVDRRLYGCLLKPRDRSHECVGAGAESEVVLLVFGGEQRLRQFQITGYECADQSQGFFFVCHSEIPPKIHLM